MVRTIVSEAIAFACANPEPEIDPAEALKAEAFIVATGQSDYPNHKAFPGEIFKEHSMPVQEKLTKKWR